VGYILQNNIEVTILINGSEYYLDSFNQLQFLHVGMSTKTNMPTCHFAVQDVTHFFDVINLQDGIPIQIAIKALGGSTVTYNFRKFNHKKKFNGQCFEYEIDGYLDAPLYWSQTSLAGVQGASSDALSSIASTCGLQFSGTQTADSQLWLPRSKTYGEFVKSIVQRGYASATSYMASGVDFTGKLIYRDVNNLPPSTSTITLGQIQQGSWVCTDYHPVAVSGLTNKMQGYQHTRFNQSLVSPTLSQPYSSLQLTPDVSSPLYNQQLGNQITSGYKSFGGIDVGNTHMQYELAYYQNQRYASYFSMAVEFQMYTPTTYTLFDKFTFAVDNDVQKADAPYAGDYTVASKAWYIQGGWFCEKILGVRMGTNLPS
jgi:hypothetical protein